MGRGLGRVSTLFRQHLDKAWSKDGVANSARYVLDGGVDTFYNEHGV